MVPDIFSNFIVLIPNISLGSSLDSFLVCLLGKEVIPRWLIPLGPEICNNIS